MLCIWTTPRDHTSEWESSWILELLSPISNLLTHVHDPTLSLSPEEPSIVVIQSKTKERNQALGRYLSSFQYTFSLIHISDENFSFDYSIYNFPNCKKVWRNYWHPYFQKIKNVSYFALGYKKDYALYSSDKERTKTWCFAGDLKNRHPERAKAINCFTTIPDHIFVTESGDSFTNRETGLDTQEYKEMFVQSHFALCPPGNSNMDSFRICEALEVGTIPIVVTVTNRQNYTPCYWEFLFRTPIEHLPFVIEDNWEKCKNRVIALLNKPEELNKLHEECKVFWSSYKQILQEEWKELLE